MIELINKRKANEKHFLKDNGNIEIQLFKDNIHYLKNGNYEEISNVLNEKDEIIENTENDYKVNFNKKNASIKYIKDDNYLEFTPKKAKNIDCIIEKNTKELSSVLYKDIFENLDIEYILSFFGVKENIIIKDAIDISKLEFDINTNLSLSLQNNVLIAKKKDIIIFSFNVPYMKDSLGEESNDVSYNLKEKNKKYIFSISYSLNWIKSNDRKFPIVIDPNYENNTNVEDTYIYPGDTNDVRYNRIYLNAGVEKVNNQDVVNRALMRFQLPSDLGPADEIISARLNLVGYMAVEQERELLPSEAALNTEKLLNVHQLTSDWTLQNANWSNMNNAYNSEVENIAYIARSYLKYGPSGLEPWYALILNDCLITNLVKKWLNGTPNYGIMIKQAEETYINEMTPKLFSSNYGNGGLAPFLTIEYRNQNGLEPYYDYMSQSFTNGATYVNTFNGNLVGLFNISHTIGLFPASIGIVYNTNDVIENNNTIFGKGYKLTYDQTIEDISSGSDYILKYIDGDGTIHMFYGQENDQHIIVYSDIDGLNFEVTQINSNYVLKDKTGNSMTFVLSNNKYYLSKITNVCNKEIEITRNSSNYITKIKDCNNNEINVTYGTNTITFVSPSETSTLNYENNNLKTIVTKEGTTTFTYDASDKITKITDVTGLSISYEYLTGSIKKIRKITQYGLNNTEGESFTLDYNLFSTKITDNKGKITTNIYGYYGNLLSSNSMADGTNIKNAYSITKTYGNENENINKILTSTVPNQFSKNYFYKTTSENISSNAVFSNNMSVSDYTDSNFNGISLVEFASNNIIQYALMGFTLPINKTYYVSLYIKTTLKAKIKFFTDSSNPIYEEEFTPSNEYTKISFSFDKEDSQDLMMRLEHENNCSTYIGDLRIDDENVDINLIDNPDFSNNTNGWNLNSTSGSIYDYFDVVNIDNFGNKALKIDMESTNSTYIYTEIPKSGTADDLYYLSFWYKNNGVETGIDPTKSYDPSGGIGAANTVTVVGIPQSGEVEYCVPATPLNACRDVWQYCHILFTPVEDYESIRVYLHQAGDAGTLYLTNFSLIKKLKTNRYEYDEYGNVTEVKEIDDSNLFNYDKNNELISATNPRGRHFKIEYDNTITDRVIRAISSSGVSNKVVYDENGNPIQTKISKDYPDEIESGYYKIRQKGTNNYLKIENNSLTLKYDYCSNTIFRITKENDLYKISDVAIENRYITESSNRIILSNYGNNEFKLEKNKNASYHIYLEDVNENKKYLKWVENHFEFVNNYSDIEENFLYEYYLEDSTRMFIQSETEYTQDGRFVTKIKDSLLNETNFAVNSINGLITKVTDSQENEITYTYNNKEQVTKIAQGNKEINYTYNNQNVLSEINQGNKTYKLNYDNFLNITNIKINNRNLVTNVYDENNGNLLSSTYGNGYIVSYLYDDFDRIKKITKGNIEYNYLYNNNGNIHKIEGNNQESYYLYDSEKRLYDLTNNRYYETDYYEDGIHYIVTHRNSLNINNYYDKDDNIIKQIYTFDYETNNIKNIIINTFNKEGILLESNMGNENVKYTYDELLRNTTKKINNSYETKYEYLSIGNRTSTLIKSITNGNDKFLYKYDKLYNITDIYLNNNLIYHYTYDNYNELIEENDYRNDTKIEFVYDNEGNILSKIKRNLTTNSILNTESFSYNDSTWEDLLTSYNNDTITYDTIGNPLSIGNKSLTWHNGRQLSTYNENNLSVLYNYNLDGIRTKKTINGVETDYYLDGYKIIFEKTGNNIINYFYDINGISGLKYNNMIYYYLKNVQGDIIGIINSNNEVIVKYEYDSFGNILSIKDSNGQIITDTSNIGIINPFRYRGYYFDKETGLYYLNARYYNPNWGRFLNADEYINDENINSQNMFLYTGNNYITKIDETGQSDACVLNPEDIDVILGTGASIGTAAGTGLTLGAAFIIGVALGAFINAIANSKTQKLVCKKPSSTFSRAYIEKDKENPKKVGKDLKTCKQTLTYYDAIKDNHKDKNVFRKTVSDDCGVSQEIMSSAIGYYTENKYSAFYLAITISPINKATLHDLSTLPFYYEHYHPLKENGDNDSIHIWYGTPKYN